MFSKFAESHGGLSIPNNYLELSQKGMKRLKESKRVNVLCELAKGLGIMHPDGSDVIFPTERMPMGLLQYMVLFFNSGAGQQINCVHAVEPHIRNTLDYESHCTAKYFCWTRIHPTHLPLHYINSL